MIDTSTPRPRLGGLDGLRAIAVVLVVVYHVFPGGPVRSGFLGVDVFFVISGFLITSLLLREREATGTIRLREFWRRRARRLLPALVALVTVCATAAWIVGGDVLVRIGMQIVGAATFSYNWIAIASGTGYFAATTPELFRNLWSLAVEEQFYLVWPLVLPLFLLLRAARIRALVAGLAAVASAAAMGIAILASPADATRAYFGTDTHAFGLLLGVALAFLLSRRLAAPPAGVGGRRARTVALVVGVAAVAGLVALALTTPADDLATFPGVLLAGSVLTAVVIALATWPGSWLGRALDVAPLRWVGDRSYGIYLWHWPLLVLLVAANGGGSPDDGVPLPLGLLVVALTLAAAEVSYRVVETPLRRAGFRATGSAIAARLRDTPARRWQAITGIGVVVVALGGTSAAIAAAPARSSAEQAVRAGEEALAAPVPAAPTPAAPSPAPPPPIPGGEVTAVGDSVMLASAPALMERFPGIQVDAEVSRSMWAGPGILRELAGSGALRPYVVVALGTNGSIDAGALQQIADAVGPDRDLVLVDAYAPRSWIPGVNDELRRFADARVGVVVADWAEAIAPHEDLLAGDRIHPGSAGGRLFAGAVADALPRADRERRIALAHAAQERLTGPLPGVPGLLAAR